MKTRKPSSPTRPVPARNSRGFVIATCLLLGLAILAIYSQTFDYGFVSYDDDRYVYDNPMVKLGISFQSLSWAFTTFYASNWHPLTWISHMLDYELFGLSAGAGHAVNVLLHFGSTVILFLALLRMTNQKWQSAFVAGIFAVHPLHVESVAWIAERKDVLSAFFQMLTLLLYVRYAEKSGLRRYSVMAGAFALSLLAKPMAVTLPFVLLLLDYWPLRRMESGSGRRLLTEKLPLLAMSIVASVLTFFAQRTTAIVTLARVPLSERLANAVFAYLAYIGKAFWPAGLAVLYPIHRPPSLGLFAAALILSTVSIAAVWGIRRSPYLFVGWFWYLGMLVPVIGLVQVGFQSLADRYTYVPFVGLSIALVWTLGEICDGQPALQRAAVASGIVALVALSVDAYQQTKYWETSVALYQHALAVTEGNYVIENNLGVIFETGGREEEAIDLFRQAVAAAPDYAQALNNLGAILGQREKNPDKAIALLRRAVAADPGYAAARSNLGHRLLASGQLDEAFTQLSQALRLSPDSARIHADLGVLASLKGKLEESRQHLQEAVRLEPNDADVQSNLCIILLRLNQPDQALIACNAALKINPNHPGARAALANIERTRHP